MFVKVMVVGIILGSLAVISFNSWPLIWLGLELNLMSFVPSVMKEENNKKQAMMYFIVQSVGSIILLSSAMMTDNKASLIVFIILGIMMKLGAAPIHFWLPNVLSSLNSLGLYLIMSWQKMAPILVLSMVMITKETISYVNLLTGSIMMMSMASPLMVMIFSGISQMGWMMIIHSKLLTFFMFIYFSILVPIVTYLKTSTKNFFWGMVNAGGLPPFSGFIIKLKALMYMKKKSALLFVSASAIALSCYSRMMLNQKYKKDKISFITVASLLVGTV